MYSDSKCNMFFQRSETATFLTVLRLHFKKILSMSLTTLLPFDPGPLDYEENVRNTQRGVYNGDRSPVSVLYLQYHTCLECVVFTRNINEITQIPQLILCPAIKYF